MTQFSFGQDQYKYGSIVTTLGDTINGFILMNTIDKNAITNSHQIKLKDNLESRPIKLNADVVDQVLFSGLDNEIYTFRYVRISNTKFQLFQVLFEGDHISLFGRKVNHSFRGAFFNHPWNAQRSDFWSASSFERIGYEFYAKEKTETIASPLILSGILSKSFRKNAINYFSDCKELVEKMKNDDFSEFDVLEAILFYDRCFSAKQ